MLNGHIPLGSRYVWLFGRICSFLIIIPPLISASSGLLPIPVLLAVGVFWLLMLFQMRGWSYGYAEPDGITFVSWIKQKHVSWTEVSAVNSSSMGIRIQRKTRNLILDSILFNCVGIPVSAEKREQRQVTVETLQRWWLDRRDGGSHVG
jgi:hypothetical protein